MNLLEEVKKTNAFACLECGKCTSVCPVSRYSQQYSPRSLLNHSVKGEFDQLFQNYDLWSCLTCRRCDDVCISNIRYIDLTRMLRNQARGSVFQGRCSHAGALEMLQRIMTTPDLKQKRLDWVPADANIGTTEGEIVYFVGCSPYFDTFFTDLDLSLTDAAISSIRILNALDITPVLLPDERCCGHDLWWNGDVDNFRMLAEHNIRLLDDINPQTILFSCAECMSAFQNLYPENGFKIKADLLHISQFIAREMEKNSIQLNDNKDGITYQDPCRLGRHLGIYDEPRKVLSNNRSNGVEEMTPTGKGAMCCGVSAWMNCDGISKNIQVARLQQAQKTGADTMAVACPKCQIHFECTLKDQTIRDQYDIDIRDIATITWERMNQQKPSNLNPKEG